MPELLGKDDLSSEVRDAVRQFVIDWTDDLVSARHDSWLARWTEDAALMPPGGPRIVGHEGLAKFAAAYDLGTNYHFEDWNFAGAGDLAIVCNRIIVGSNASTGEDKLYFDQIILLRRVAASWKIQTVIFTPTSP